MRTMRPECEKDVGTIEIKGSMLIGGHIGTDGNTCPASLSFAPTTETRVKVDGWEPRGVINGKTRTEWLDLPKAPPASATKAELNAYIVEVAHLLSEAVPTMIRFADEAHTYRQRLRMADERDRTGARQLSERRTELIAMTDQRDRARRELIAMTDQRDRARRETEGLDRELQRANVRHAKDKRRIKALVNALAGLR